MALPDVLKFVSCCKDFLHDDWSRIKKTGEVKTARVCVYNLGAHAEVPNFSLESVCNVIKELEGVVSDTFDVCLLKSKPLISREIMVGADGEVSFYPRRIVHNKQADQSQSGDTLLPPPMPTKQKVHQTPDDAFMGGVEQIGNYILDHLKKVSESALLSGNIKALYLVLSSANFLKGRITLYKQVFKQAQPKGIAKVITKYDEMIHLTTEHVFNYQSDLIRSSILQDVPSHDWKNVKPYKEQESMSLCIHMWAFHIQGIRNDLWQYVAPKTAENLMASILVDSMGLLVNRYYQIEPSELRVVQMKADIAAILLTALSMLPSLISSPRYFFQSSLHNSRGFAVHRRADLLVKIAALKCCPIELLAQAFAKGIKGLDKCDRNLIDSTEIVACPSWLTFFNGDIFPRNTEALLSLPDHIATYLVLWVAASKPYPDHALLVRSLLMKNLLATRIILSFLQNSNAELTKGEPCGGALCVGSMCVPPLLPHTVCAAIIQVVISCRKSKTILSDLLKDGIVSTNMWDTMDRTQIWNVQRPPWHHALIQLFSARIAGVVAQVCFKVLQAIPPIPPAQPAHPSQMSVRLEHHLSAWTLQIFSGVDSIADTFPIALIHVCQELNGCVPATVKPVGGHVIAQLVVSAIYSIVNSRSSLNELCTEGDITDGQWDMLVAVGERLCLLHEGNYDDSISQMIRALLKRLETAEETEEDDDLDFYVDEDVIEAVSNEIADIVLSNVQGQHALEVIWEFLLRNMEWIANILGVPSLLRNQPKDSKQVLSFSRTPQMYNPLYFCNRIFYTKWNPECLVSFEGDWGCILRNDLWMPENLIKELVLKRSEFEKSAVLSHLQKVAVTKLKGLMFYKKQSISKSK